MKKVYKAYCTAERYITMAAFFTIIVLTFGNAVLRKLNHPIVWCDDISLLLFGWCAFLGADIAMRSNRLVGMDIITMNLPVKVQKILQLVVNLFITVVLVMLVIWGFDLAKMNWLRFMNTLTISYGWATLSLPIGSIMMLITITIKNVVILKHFKDDSYTIKNHNPEKDEEAEA